MYRVYILIKVINFGCLIWCRKLKHSFLSEENQSEQPRERKQPIQLPTEEHGRAPSPPSPTHRAPVSPRAAAPPPSRFAAPPAQPPPRANEPDEWEEETQKSSQPGKKCGACLVFV
jgi:type IV secretory pathway VirB10-like protein